jgi:hypothetical protein
MPFYNSYFILFIIWFILPKNWLPSLSFISIFYSVPKTHIKGVEACPSFIISKHLLDSSNHQRLPWFATVPEPIIVQPLARTSLKHGQLIDKVQKSHINSSVGEPIDLRLGRDTWVAMKFSIFPAIQQDLFGLQPQEQMMSRFRLIETKLFGKLIWY